MSRKAAPTRPHDTKASPSCDPIRAPFFPPRPPHVRAIPRSHQSHMSTPHRLHSALQARPTINNTSSRILPPAACIVAAAPLTSPLPLSRLLLDIANGLPAYIVAASATSDELSGFVAQEFLSDLPPLPRTARIDPFLQSAALAALQHAENAARRPPPPRIRGILPRRPDSLATKAAQLAREASMDLTTTALNAAANIADKQMELLWRLCCRSSHQQRTEAQQQETESRLQVVSLETQHRHQLQIWVRCLISWAPHTPKSMPQPPAPPVPICSPRHLFVRLPNFGATCYLNAPKSMPKPPAPPVPICSSRHLLVRLPNLGATCYLNAALQGLFLLGSPFRGRGAISRLVRDVFFARPGPVASELLLPIVASLGFATSAPQEAATVWNILNFAIAAEDGSWCHYGGSAVSRLECLDCRTVRFSSASHWLMEISMSPSIRSISHALDKSLAPTIIRALSLPGFTEGLACSICQSRADDVHLRSDFSSSTTWYPRGQFLILHVNWLNHPQDPCIADRRISTTLQLHGITYLLGGSICNVNHAQHYVFVTCHDGELWLLDDAAPPRRTSNWSAGGTPELLFYKECSCPPSGLPAEATETHSSPSLHMSTSLSLDTCANKRRSFLEPLDSCDATAESIRPPSHSHTIPPANLPPSIAVSDAATNNGGHPICDAVNSLHFRDLVAREPEGPPVRRRIPLTQPEWSMLERFVKASLTVLLHPADDPLITSAILFDTLNKALPQCPRSTPRRRPSPPPAHVRNAAALKKRFRQLSRQKRARGEPQSSHSAELIPAVGMHNHFIRVTRAADRFDDLLPTMKLYHGNPAKFSKAVLDGTQPGSTKAINVTATDAEKFFRQVYADRRNDPLPPPPLSLVSPSPPRVAFHQAQVTLSELRRVLRRKSNSSAPGPDGIPYTIYKRCEILQRVLVQLYNDVIRTGRVPPSWGVANIVLIPKPSGIIDDVKELRPIALTNTVGKLFTAILSSRLESFLRSNEFWDATQKGFATATQGCIDHAFTVQQALQDARSHQKSIAVAWLDLKNAFGSVSHKMVQFALRSYGVPATWRNLIFALYNPLCARVSTPAWCTPYFPYQKGVFQGDPLSPVIFNMAFSCVIAQAKLLNDHPYVTRCGAAVGLTAYADDLAIIATSAKELQRILDGLAPVMSWMRLTFNPKKCVGLILVRGVVSASPLFIDKVPFAHLPEDQPFKFLGVLIPPNGSHKTIFGGIKSRATEWWGRISAANVTIAAKLEIYKFSLTRLRWQLAVYDWPLREVEALQHIANGFLRTWLRLPQSANLHIVFSTRGLFVPLLTTVFKAAQVSKHINLQSNPDPIVSALHLSRPIDHRAKWQVGNAITSIQAFTAAEDFTAMMLGKANKGTAGLGYRSSSHIRTVTLCRRASRYLAEEECSVQLGEVLALPTYHDLWEAIERDMVADRHWQRALLGLPDKFFAFALKAATNSLPTNRNLTMWRKLESPNCALCNAMQTVGHVLNFCPTALELGRFTFRHDLVLGVFLCCLSKARPELAVHYSLDYITPSRSYSFPIPVHTNLRPDVVVSSPDGATIWLVELTVPLPHNTTTANSFKTSKYAALAAEIAVTGRVVNMAAFEISSLGNVARSTPRALRSLGLSASQCRAVAISLSQAAVRGSFVVFQHRNMPSMPRQQLLDLLPTLPPSRIHPLASSSSRATPHPVRFLPSTSVLLPSATSETANPFSSSCGTDLMTELAGVGTAVKRANAAQPMPLRLPLPPLPTANYNYTSTACAKPLAEQTSSVIPVPPAVSKSPARNCLPPHSLVAAAGPPPLSLSARPASPTSKSVGERQSLSCPNCSKTFTTHQGLTLHRSRWCSTVTPRRDSHANTVGAPVVSPLSQSKPSKKMAAPLPTPTPLSPPRMPTAVLPVLAAPIRVPGPKRK